MTVSCESQILPLRPTGGQEIEAEWVSQSWRRESSTEPPHVPCNFHCNRRDFTRISYCPVSIDIFWLVSCWDSVLIGRHSLILSYLILSYLISNFAVRMVSIMKIFGEPGDSES